MNAVVIPNFSSCAIIRPFACWRDEADPHLNIVHRAVSRLKQPGNKIQKASDAQACCGGAVDVVSANHDSNQSCTENGSQVGMF
jgi:hypothetical protein